MQSIRETGIHHISVFGSSILRVPPDTAVIECKVVNTRPTPREAFESSREAGKRVQAYLQSLQVYNAAASRTNLSESTKYVQGEYHFLGYQAQFDVMVVVKDLARLEEILSGLVDAGVTNITGVSYQTSRLKEHRAEARRLAVAAAREKAENYCLAAGAVLGDVIRIEDRNPDFLRSSGGHGHSSQPAPIDHEDESFDPGSILVGGAVTIVYALLPKT